MKISIVLLLFISIKFSESLTCDKRENDSNLQTKLKNDLFCKYDKYIRPGDSSTALKVNVRLNVKDFDYSDDQNTMTIESWMTLVWNDSKLIWNPADYGGIESIHMKQDYLWTPELKLYNAHVPSSMGTCQVIDCVIKSTSSVACVSPCSFTAHCKDFGIKNWPFDVQNCTFTFGSWMKTGSELNYNADRIKIITRRLRKNNQWNLLGATSKYNEGVYSFSNESFPSVTFALVIERHNGFHQVSTISSAGILLTTNLLVLFLAPESLVRLILALANILSCRLMIEFLYWMIPFEGDTTPKVFIFFGDLQFYAIFLLIESLIIKMLVESSEKPSNWMTNLSTSVKSNSVIAALLASEILKKLPEDAEALVENVEQEKAVGEVRKTFCMVFDRILALVTVILFSVMFISLFPRNYISFNYDPIEVATQK